MIKKIILSPLVFLESLADRILTIAGALTFAQFPAFIVQYQQRLGGHVDELTSIVKAYKTAAAGSGKTLEQYISVHIQSSAADFSSTGKIMAASVERYNDLSQTLTGIKEAEGFMKFTAFIKNYDMAIFKETASDFVPALNFSIDTLYYSIAGIVFIMISYFLLKKFLKILFNRISGRSRKNLSTNY